MKKQISIIGSGFSSIAASCYLAKQGFEVNVYEKNSTLGGRATQLANQNFVFDMGPTWYWMPDVFERFFNDFDKSANDFYTLEKLSPAYRVYFGKGDFIDIEDNIEAICKTFDKYENKGAQKLTKFMAKANDNYNIAIKNLVYLPGDSIFELITWQTIKRIKSFFTSISTDIRKLFTNQKLIQILEFPVLFLGAKPSKTPSFYSFMNYADFGLGTFHPKKGMQSVVHGMVQLAESLGVKFFTNCAVEKLNVENGKVTSLQVNGNILTTDIVLSGADYHFTETLLSQQHKSYSEGYWNKKVFAPSALLFYVGFNKKIPNVQHHTLFFDTSFVTHSEEIYDNPTWPKQPLFYASFPSKTDNYFAKENTEAAIFLIPIAPNLKDTKEIRDKYFNLIISRLEFLINEKVMDNIVFKESFCINDFKQKYNSYKGNAYGLANTLLQTAFLRPKLKSKKISNLFFTGQLTVPGPGVPPAIISGKIVSNKIIKQFT